MSQNNLNKDKIAQAHQEQIKNLNDVLHETIELASADFLQLCNVLTDFGKHPENKENVSLAVQELQYVDALRQKLQHVCHFQNAILTGEKIEHDDGEELDIREITGSVLKLNYYQTVAAHDEFGKVVFKVQTIMRKIKTAATAAADSFTNLVRINDNFRMITSMLSFLANEYVSTSDLDLSHVTDYFSDHYSMLSERMVLNWCVSSEYESIDDFRKYYSNQERSQSIELF